jgi:DNA-binding response OmpR family regulator
MLSASTTEQQAALDAGARFYLLKPYVGKNLVAAVDSAISENESE